MGIHRRECTRWQVCIWLYVQHALLASAEMTCTLKLSVVPWWVLKGVCTMTGVCLTVQHNKNHCFCRLKWPVQVYTNCCVMVGGEGSVNNDRCVFDCTTQRKPLFLSPRMICTYTNCCMVVGVEGSVYNDRCVFDCTTQHKPLFLSPRMTCTYSKLH